MQTFISITAVIGIIYVAATFYFVILYVIFAGKTDSLDEELEETLTKP